MGLLGKNGNETARGHTRLRVASRSRPLAMIGRQARTADRPPFFFLASGGEGDARWGTMGVRRFAIACAVAAIAGCRRAPPPPPVAALSDVLFPGCAAVRV